MVAGIFPPFFMDCPSLKYYFPSLISLKLRIYITKTYIQEISLETTSYGGLECLFYCKADPCQKSVLKFVNEILSWLLSYTQKQPKESSIAIKLPSNQEDLAIVRALSSLKFGSFITERFFLEKLGLQQFNLSSWIKKHPFTPFIPAHRVLPSQLRSSTSSHQLRLFNLLRSFEETLSPHLP